MGMDLSKVKLVFEVYDHDRITKDDYLGHNAIALSEEYRSDGDTYVAKTVPILDLETGHETSGTMKFTIRIGSKNDIFSIRDEYIFENERWNVTGWHPCVPGKIKHAKRDPYRFSRLDGEFTHADFAEVEKTFPTYEEGEIIENWRIVSFRETDIDGFQYGRFNFANKGWYSAKPKFSNIRRRLWARQVRCFPNSGDDSESAMAMRQSVFE